MNFLVLDGSVTLAWIYGDETPDRCSVAENGGAVPSKIP
jgi:hypothetical protein